jgi:hypothetical protein
MPDQGKADLPMVKMIVLEVDEPHPDDHKEKGSLGEILERHFLKAGRRHDPPLGVEVDQRFVVEDKGGKIPSVEEFEGVKGILITGSTYDAYGDNEWILKLIDLIKSESDHQPFRPRGRVASDYRILLIHDTRPLAHIPRDAL